MKNLIEYEDTNYFYAFPLQQIEYPEYGINVKYNYTYCSLSFPYSLQSESKEISDLYMIRVYRYFTESLEKDIETIKSKTLFFGESRFFPYIPTRGVNKWIKIGEEEVGERKRKDLPNLRTTNFNSFDYYKDRDWYLLKNGGFHHKWNKYKVDWEQVRDLEDGNFLSDFIVLEKVYLLLILENLSSKQILPPTHADIKKILFELMIKHNPQNSKDILKATNEFIDFHYAELTDKFEWSDNLKKQMYKEHKKHEEYQLSMLENIKSGNKTKQYKSPLNLADQKPMEEYKYWTINQNSLLQTKTKNQFIKKLTKELGKLTSDEIVSFYQLTNILMNNSYTSHLWCAAYIMNGGCSDDGFEYFRYWLISQGKDVYYKALDNPDSLIDVLQKKNFVYELEEFRFIVIDAFEKVNENNMIEDIGYEIFSFSEENYPEIEFDWDEDDEKNMAKICPRLAEHFF